MEEPIFKDESQVGNGQPMVSQENSGNGGGKRLERDLQKAMLGGVFAGLADYLQWEVSLLRIGFVFVCLCGGPLALLLYLFAWIFIPLRPGSQAVATNDAFGKVFKFGCLGALLLFLFPLLIIGLLLIIPSIYMSDLSTLMSDPNFFACDDISWDIQYNPNIPQLVLGAFLTFVFPIVSMIFMSGKEEVWGLSKRLAYIFVALIAGAGVMMIVSALTAN